MRCFEVEGSMRALIEAPGEARRFDGGSATSGLDTWRRKAIDWIGKFVRRVRSTSGADL